MYYHKHQHLGTGFMATAEPSDKLPIQQAGEVWAAAEWSINRHVHTGWEFYFQAKGESVWEINNTQITVPENGAYLIRAGTWHRLKRFSKGGVHFYWTVFPRTVVPVAVRKADCWKRDYTILHQAHALLHPMQGIIQETAIKEPWQRQACGWYVSALCATFTRVAENHQPERHLSRHPGAERAQRLLSSRLEHPWRLDELARLSGVSLQHLIVIFRQEYGQTPMRALQRMRLEEARRRLKQTDKSVTDIAMDLGFASSQHLARCCHATFGVTPTQIRNA